MAQVNRYDGTNITNNIERLTESVMNVMSKARSLEVDIEKANIAADATKYAAKKHATASMYAADQSFKSTKYSSDTNQNIAELRASTDKDIAELRANTDILLKNLGFDFDKVMENMKHVNIKNRMKWENELLQELENLKTTNAIRTLDVQYQNNLKLANFNADEALRRTIIEAVGAIVQKSSVLTGAEKVAMFQALQAGLDYLYDAGRTRNDKFAFGVVDPQTKELLNLTGVTNEEENKPGWEMRPQLRKGTQAERQAKYVKGRGFKKTGDRY